MDDPETRDRAIALLQQLGLNNYEAECFVALTRLPGRTGTARDISDISEVPRTRVYDVVRVLETEGIVEVQHSNPQRFRAVSAENCSDTLREKYESRTEKLQGTLEDLNPAERGEAADGADGVWSFSDRCLIERWTHHVVDEAEQTLVVMVGHEEALTEELADRLCAAGRRAVDVVVGVPTCAVREAVTEMVADSEVVVTDVEWPRGTPLVSDAPANLGRLVLADGRVGLVSSVRAESEQPTEANAVLGRGHDNGFVTAVRWMVRAGPLPAAVPEPHD